MADSANPMTGEILAPHQPGGAYATTRAAIDVQITTAKAFPRNTKGVVQKLSQFALTDDATAESCIYSLKRGGKTIRDASIRFAEILAYTWGNLRVEARIVDEGRDFIVVRGECHDLETNNSWSQDVTRRIVGSNGQRYDVDLIGVTAMAAASIAQRDCVLKAVPRFLYRSVVDACIQRIAGDVKTLADRRIKAVGQFSMLGVTPEMIFKKLKVPGINEITADHLIDLVGTFNAIREGETTVEAEFGETTITGRLATGGSPLAAAEDDGKVDTAPEGQAGPAQGDAQAQPGAKAGGAAGEAGAAPDADGAGGGAPAAAKDDRGPAPKAKPERRARAPRQDRDADAPPREQSPAAAGQAAPQAETAGKPVDQPKAADAKPPSFDELERRWQNDCARATTLEALRGVAVRYGEEGVLEHLSDDEKGQISAIYEHAKTEIAKEEQARKSKKAAEDYEAAKNGGGPAPDAGAIDDAQQVYEGGDKPDHSVGEGTGEQPATPAAAPAASISTVPWDRFNSFGPEPSEGPEVRKIWQECVELLWAAKTKDEVMARYDEIEKNGKLDQLSKLSEMTFHNMKAIRFTIRKEKPEA